ncbi:Uncharacterized protein Rs2_09866 [Raphanus sativus]|nr:Uncharacterized protein Rs2_09866 [Raphanus sativus]
MRDFWEIRVFLVYLIIRNIDDFRFYNHVVSSFTKIVESVDRCEDSSIGRKSGRKLILWELMVGILILWRLSIYCLVISFPEKSIMMIFPTRSSYLVVVFWEQDLYLLLELYVLVGDRTQCHYRIRDFRSSIACGSFASSLVLVSSFLTDNQYHHFKTSAPSVSSEMWNPSSIVSDEAFVVNE